MPEMDGHEATRQLRSAGHDGAIVALTAHAIEGEKERCLAEGVDGFGTKPVDRQRLADCVRLYRCEPSARAS